LQGEIEQASRRSGFPPEKKFTPHVTVARLKQIKPDDPVKYLSSQDNFLTNSFKINRSVLMASKESVGGGLYIIKEH